MNKFELDLERTKFIDASQFRILNIADSIGENISPFIMTAIRVELKTMYDCGYGHCEGNHLSWEKD